MPLKPEELALELAAASTLEPQFPEGRFAGRGIVICAGGARMFTCVWVCIGMLRRHLGCTLPIEVWHIGPEEMGAPMRSLLELLGAQAVDALEVAKRHGVERLGGWELKSYALLHSRFREVLLLDADNVPVRDPSFLFDRPEFQQTGAMFWPDCVRLSPTNAIWAITGLAPFESPSFESGQILLDKSKCWRALSLAHWENQRSDAFYDLLHGDKDTFLIAWLLLGAPFYLIPHQPKMLDLTLCQRDPDGKILFQHRNGAKWVLRGINPKIEGFRFEDECLGLLAELAGLWDGSVFNPPPRSDAAREQERRLAHTRDFLFLRVSSDERRLQLLPDHRVGAGAKEREFYWYVADAEDGFELTLCDGHYRSCALRCAADEIWRGLLLYRPGVPVELIPAAGDDVATPLRHRAPNGEALSPLLERALTIYEALPHDEEVMRDFAGFIRTLAILDPAVGERLRDQLEHWPSSGDQAELVRFGLRGLAEPIHRVGLDAIDLGHNWNSHQQLPHGYDPII